MEKAVEFPAMRYRATLCFDDGERVIEGEYRPFIGPIHPNRVKRWPFLYRGETLSGRVLVQDSFDPNEPLKL